MYLVGVKVGSAGAWASASRRRCIRPWTGPASRRGARAAVCVGGRVGGRPVGCWRGAPVMPSPQHTPPPVATVCSCTRQPPATCAPRWPSRTARRARRDVPWRRWPRGWAVCHWRATALRSAGDRGKRPQHSGTFLHPCDWHLVGRHVPEVWPLVNPFSENLFLKVYS